MIAPPKKRSQVVVVDARPDDYAGLLRQQASTGSEFEFFQSGRDALRHDPKVGPGLWIININLPDMSGLDLYHMLVARWPDTPVYLVGDDYRPEDEINARASGATFYFCKPLQSEWLRVANLAEAT